MSDVSDKRMTGDRIRAFDEARSALAGIERQQENLLVEAGRWRDKFETLVAALRVGSVQLLFDADGRLTEVSAAAERALGLSRDELVAAFEDDIADAGTLERLRGRIEEVLAGDGARESLEVVLRGEGGHPTSFELIFVSRTDDEGEVVGIEAFALPASAEVGSAAAPEGYAEFEKAMDEMSERVLGGRAHRLDQALSTLGDFFKVDRCAISRYDEAKRAFSVFESWHREGATPLPSAGQSISISRIPWAYSALGAGEPVVVVTREDLPADAKSERRLLEDIDVTAVLLAPVRFDDSLHGFVSLQLAGQPREWGELEILSARRFGDNVAAALWRDELVGRLEEAEREVKEAVHKASEADRSAEKAADKASEAEAAASEAAEELEAAKRRADEARAEIDEAEERAAAASAEAEKARAEAAVARDELEEAHAETAALREEVEEARSEAKAAGRKLEELEAETKGLRRRIDAVEAELERERSRTQQLGADVEELQTQLDEASAEIEGARSSSRLVDFDPDATFEIEGQRAVEQLKAAQKAAREAAGREKAAAHRREESIAAFPNPLVGARELFDDADDDRLDIDFGPQAKFGGLDDEIEEDDDFDEAVDSFLDDVDDVAGRLADAGRPLDADGVEDPSVEGLENDGNAFGDDAGELAVDENGGSAENEEPNGALPVMAGLNVEAGLAEVGGNSELYRSLLGKFRRDYHSAGAKVAAAIEKENLEVAHLLVHAIKGVAGHIGADGVRDAAEELETALIARDATKRKAALDVFSAALNEVVGAIEQVENGREVTLATADTAAEGHVSDPGVLRSYLEGLRQHLEAERPKQCQLVVREITARKWPDDLSADVDRLADLIRTYRFDEARASFKELIRRLR